MMYKIPEKKCRLKPDNERIKDVMFMAWVHKVHKPKCYVCGRQYTDAGLNYTALHHIKEHSSDVKNDHNIIPLCNETCHLGRTGHVSPHGTPKEFREKYPIEDQRLYSAKMYSEYILSVEWLDD